MMICVTHVTNVTHSRYLNSVRELLFPYSIKIFKTGYSGYMGYVDFQASTTEFTADMFALDMGPIISNAKFLERRKRHE